jgi:hypothetical protein
MLLVVLSALDPVPPRTCTIISVNAVTDTV